MRKLSFIISLAVCALSALPAGAAGDNAGKSAAMAFSAVNSDPVSLGMGGAGLALTSSPAWASFGNISSLAFNEKVFALSAGYRQWAPGKDNCPEGGLSIKLGRSFWLSAGGGFQTGESITEYDASGNSMGEFTPSALRVNLGAAYRINGFLGAGVAAHFLHSAVASNAKYSTVSFDLSAIAKFAGFNVSAGARNIGLPVKDGEGQSHMVPGEIFVAGAYPLHFGESSLNIAADAAAYISGGLAASAGVEYGFKDLIFVRAGGRVSNAALPGFLSAGLGFKLKGLSLNAAYVILPQELSNSFCASLAFAF